MVQTDGNKITMTRGDTAKFELELTNDDGEKYIPLANDKIYFRVKQVVEKPGYLIEKLVDNDTLILSIEPEDTENLKVGSYYYEVEVISANNFHFTAITKTLFKLTVEIEDHG